MSPSVLTIDTTADISLPTPKQNGRYTHHPRKPTTLLLAPPSIASHQEKLAALSATYPLASSDLQMLDRLSAGLVTLPPSCYALVLLLTDADGSLRDETAALLTRDVFARLVPAMQAGGRLAAQDGRGVDAREALLAGLVAAEEEGGGGVFVKPEYAEDEVVPLRLGRKKNGEVAAHSSAGPAVGSVTVEVAGRETRLDMVPPAVKSTPAGVGFVDLDDDLGEYEEGDELVDMDDIMTEEEMNRPIQKPPACPPGRKRACADCTCGLVQRLQKQEDERRKKADGQLNAIKLKSDELNELELDLTVKGKTGSCGSCSLGDAFRCADCPYMGLPAFKPGEEVTILNNIPQL